MAHWGCVFCRRRRWRRWQRRSWRRWRHRVVVVLTAFSIGVDTVWGAERVGVWLRTAIRVGVVRLAVYLEVGCDEAGD
jgi:hypothetical protein